MDTGGQGGAVVFMLDTDDGNFYAVVDSHNKRAYADLSAGNMKKLIRQLDECGADRSVASKGKGGGISHNRPGRGFHSF